MRPAPLPLLLFLAFLGCASPGGTRGDVDRVLDDFHLAAAEADGDRYFAHFAPEGVFLGTDASERWTVDEFRAYAEPHFSEGRGWTYHPQQRHVAFDPAGDVAWVDELLTNDAYGEVRGTAVLRRVGTDWKIAHYSLTFLVPNGSAKEVVEVIRAADAGE